MTKKIFLLILCTFLVVGVSAQKKKTSKKKTPIKTEVKTESELPDVSEVDLLLDAYCFEEASELIQEEITKAQKKKQPTGLLEERAEKARIGENMLNATQKVVFIDSFVVNKNDFFRIYRLDPSCGTITTYNNIFTKDQQISTVQANSTIYMNEFQDQIFYSSTDKQGNSKLNVRSKIGEEWGQARSLVELSGEGESQAYPYVLSDGTTLYYASNDKNSLGGYDIYVTRYNSDTDKYLKPENIGMPFNSPFNDYLYTIDEANNLGYFISDRYQTNDKVCVYIFIPTDSREIYEISDDNADSIRALARISSIKASQKNSKELAAAKERLQTAMNTTYKKVMKSDFNFFVRKGIVYNDVQNFKSAKAMELAISWVKTTEQRKSLLKELHQNRMNYANGSTQEKQSLKATLLKQERNLEQLDEAITTLETNIRQLEQATLGIKD